MSEVIHASDSDFKEKVLSSKLPVLVDFYADWCAPCKMVAPVVEQVAKEYAGRLKVCKVNVDESPVAASSYQVMSIPTLIIFRDGAPVSSVVGAVSFEALAQKIDEVLRG